MTRMKISFSASRSLITPAAPAALATLTSLGLAGIVLFAGLASGCDDSRPIGWERERHILGPIALKDSVAYIDSARDRVITVAAASHTPVVHTFAIGRRAVFARATPDRSHLAVITRGEEAVVEGQVDEDPALWLIDTGNPSTRPVSYAIGSPFDRLAIAADGRTALAHFSAEGMDTEGFFRNPNEIAIVDLGAPPSDENPARKTVRSFGSVPDGVVLSPPMVIPGADDATPRTFAFVLGQGNLTVIDATHPERREVSIRLDLPGAVVQPREIAFAPHTATAYVRSDNARDVLEVAIRPDALTSGDDLSNDYLTALAELGAGAGPADIAVYDDLAGRRMILAAAPGTHQAMVIDAETAEVTTIDVPDPIDRIVLFPSGGTATPRIALLASIGARLPRVHLLRLDGITDDLTYVDLTSVAVDKPVLDVVPVPGRELAMIVHDDARTVLGLLDVALGSVSPLLGVGTLDAYDFSSDGDFLIGVTDDVARIGLVELGNLHPSQVRLDDTPARVFAMPDGSIYIDHDDPFGRATILPSPRAGRSDAIVLTGFLLADLFAQEF